jgi:radical SAM protein with 4Fe4S-binding SPASM domain
MITEKKDLTQENLAHEMQSIAGKCDVETIDDLEFFPKFFQIETTRLCNASCPFCPVEKWDKSTPFMSDNLYKKIADELIEYKDWIKFVDPQRAGEPLLDKKIYDRVAYLKQGGIKHVALTTNASALNKVNATRLLDSGLDELMLSIDSVQKEKYTNTRVGLDYDTVMANIRGFFQLRDEKNPDCIIRVRGVSFFDDTSVEDASELESWTAFWDAIRKPHDRIYMKRAHTWGNQLVIDGHSPEYGWVYHPCIIPWSTMHISAMGTVALCPHDYDAIANLGDINTQSIAEVWRGEKMREVRRQHATGRRNEIEFCQGCQVFDDEFSLERGKRKADGSSVPKIMKFARKL